MSNEPGVGGKVMLVDVGGGSCEITLSEHKRIKDTISLPLGAVRLTQEFIPDDLPSEEDLARMKQFITRELRRAHRRFQPAITSGHAPLVIATSGTAAALSEAHAALVKPEAAAKSRTKIIRIGTAGQVARQSAASQVALDMTTQQQVRR